MAAIELEAARLYEIFVQSDLFKRAYEDRTLGESIEIAGGHE